MPLACRMHRASDPSAATTWIDPGSVAVALHHKQMVQAPERSQRLASHLNARPEAASIAPPSALLYSDGTSERGAVQFRLPFPPACRQNIGDKPQGASYH